MTMRVVGSMSLNQMASDRRATNGSAKVEDEDEARVALKDVDVEVLIGLPPADDAPAYRLPIEMGLDLASRTYFQSSYP